MRGTSVRSAWWKFHHHSEENLTLFLKNKNVSKQVLITNDKKENVRNQVYHGITVLIRMVIWLKTMSVSPSGAVSFGCCGWLSGVGRPLVFFVIVIIASLTISSCRWRTTIQDTASCWFRLRRWTGLAHVIGWHIFVPVQILRMLIIESADIGRGKTIVTSRHVSRRGGMYQSPFFFRIHSSDRSVGNWHSLLSGVWPTRSRCDNMRLQLVTGSIPTSSEGMISRRKAPISVKTFHWIDQVRRSHVHALSPADSTCRLNVVFGQSAWTTLSGWSGPRSRHHLTQRPYNGTIDFFVRNKRLYLDKHHVVGSASDVVLCNHTTNGIHFCHVPILGGFLRLGEDSQSLATIRRSISDLDLKG